MWLIILLFSLSILHCIYLLCKISIKTKKEESKRNISNKTIIEVVSTPDDFRTWDIKNAKDVEFTKVTESFNRKSDLD